MKDNVIFIDLNVKLVPRNLWYKEWKDWILDDTIPLYKEVDDTTDSVIHTIDLTLHEIEFAQKVFNTLKFVILKTLTGYIVLENLSSIYAHPLYIKYTGESTEEIQKV